MKMGTCEQPGDQGEQPTQRERPATEENNLMITGPPASRTVIDNLKKLLVQRQHSRESDTENNKNAARSNSGSNSDAAFYSQFSTSSSDSDDSSDDYMIFQEISNQAECNANGSNTNHSTGRRRHRRRRSYSSSSSSSPSPVARSRRKVTRVNLTLNNSVGGDGEGVEMKTVAPSGSQPPHSQQLPSALEDAHHHDEKTKEEHDSANSTSSHKDSSSEDDIPGSGNIITTQQGSKSLSTSITAESSLTGPVSGGRCPKLKSRRDRDRKRKRSELNYATHRPNKLMKEMEETSSKVALNSSKDIVVCATGGGNEGNETSVPNTGPGDANITTAPATANSGNDGVSGAELSAEMTPLQNEQK